VHSFRKKPSGEISSYASAFLAKRTVPRQWLTAGSFELAARSLGWQLRDQWILDSIRTEFSVPLQNIAERVYV
jgi:hypothetical protein